MAARVRSLQKAAHPSRNTDDFNTYFGCPSCTTDETKATAKATAKAAAKAAAKYIEVPFQPELQYTDKVARALRESTGNDTITCEDVFQAHHSDDAVQDELRLTCVDGNKQEIVLITKPPQGTRMHFV